MVQPKQVKAPIYVRWGKILNRYSRSYKGSIQARSRTNEERIDVERQRRRDATLRTFRFQLTGTSTYLCRQVLYYVLIQIYTRTVYRIARCSLRYQILLVGTYPTYSDGIIAFACRWVDKNTPEGREIRRTLPATVYHKVGRQVSQLSIRGFIIQLLGVLYSARLLLIQKFAGDNGAKSCVCTLLGTLRKKLGRICARRFECARGERWETEKVKRKKEKEVGILTQLGAYQSYT